jgi:hypothetical protein
LRAGLPVSMSAVWPDYASPHLMPFRTPDPQVSFVPLVGLLMLLAGFCRYPNAEPSRRPSRSPPRPPRAVRGTSSSPRRSWRSRDRS